MTMLNNSQAALFNIHIYLIRRRLTISFYIQLIIILLKWHDMYCCITWSHGIWVSFVYTINTQNTKDATSFYLVRKKRRRRAFLQACIKSFGAFLPSSNANTRRLLTSAIPSAIVQYIRLYYV